MQIGVVNPYTNKTPTDVNTQPEPAASKKINSSNNLDDKISISLEAVNRLDQEGKLASISSVQTAAEQQPLTGGGVEPPTVQAYTGGGVEPPKKTDTGGGVEPPAK